MSLSACIRSENGDNTTCHSSLSCCVGPVLVFGEQKQLQLSCDSLALSGTETPSTAKSKSFKDLTLTWPDVVCASKDLSSKSGQQALSFTLHYINQVNNKCRVHKVQITVTDGQVDHWVSAITDKCSRVPGRPRKVFVVVNPIGGAGQGRQIYQKTVAPLFELAKITTDVVYTKRSKHATELCEKLDFSSYDAIIAVGGDGSYNEVLQGVTLQVQKAAGVDIDNPDIEFVTPEIIFGIIPAGTGNVLASWCFGTKDVVSAALNIIRGENHKSQIMKVYSGMKYTTLCAQSFGKGEFSDLMKKGEDLRWMGRMRNLVLIPALVQKPRMFKCQVEYKLADQSNNSTPEDNQSPEAEWRTFTENSMCGVMAANIEAIPWNTDLILKPYGTYVNLLVDSGCGRLDLMKTIMKLVTGKNAAAMSLPPKLSRISQVIGFNLKMIPDERENERSSSSSRARVEELAHYLAIDGEPVRMDSTDIQVRVQSGYAALYGQQWSPSKSTEI